MLVNQHLCDSSGKQGDNYDARSIKLKGAVTSTSMISKSKHFAVGTEKGIVRNFSIVQNVLDLLELLGSKHRLINTTNPLSLTSMFVSQFQNSSTKI